MRRAVAAIAQAASAPPRRALRAALGPRSSRSSVSSWNTIGVRAGRGPHVALDAVALGDRRLERRQRVFSMMPLGGIVQPAVRDRLQEGRAIGMALSVSMSRIGVDLDGAAERQARDADGGARVAPLVAEHLDHEVGGAVDAPAGAR